VLASQLAAELLRELTAGQLRAIDGARTERGYWTMTE
jgi:hypothetical protein